jgi:hypothetical protein
MRLVNKKQNETKRLPQSIIQGGANKGNIKEAREKCG